MKLWFKDLYTPSSALYTHLANGPMKLPNVTLTPHIAGASMRTVTYAAEQVAEDVRRYIAGEPQNNRCT